MKSLNRLKPKPPLILVDCESKQDHKPFMVTKRYLNCLFASPTLVLRMIRARWFECVIAGGPGRESLYDFETAERAYARLKTGEMPGDLLAGKDETKGSTNDCD